MKKLSLTSIKQGVGSLLTDEGMAMQACVIPSRRKSIGTPPDLQKTH